MHAPRYVKTTLFLSTLSALSAFALVACNQKEERPPSAAATSEALAPTPAPAAAPPFDVAKVQERAKAIWTALPANMDSATNPGTEAKLALGRQLYYEKRLSKNQDASCNTCHDLDKYGIDARVPGGKTSAGHRGQMGARNSPTVYNAALHFTQYWDGRAADVEAQAKGPILDPVEMAVTADAQVVKMLKSIPGYLPLFKAAFPEAKDPITYDNLAKAIGAFERRLVTPGRFDKFVAGDKSALTEEEAKGLSLFMDVGCLACHSGPAFGGGMFQKLGLLKPYPTTDTGRFGVTKNESDKFFFKVPTLRNVDDTAPYFHDGSVPTLQAAVQLMTEYQTAKGTLSESELVQMVAFLKSLTGTIPHDYVKEPAALPPGKATPKPDPT